ncbi:MAG TPA: TIGR04282 family arsenosugar biosynthesis glycosyltransferase [Burkholderiaceae bacterium]|nr:TIGR04282 family arsenosugar biosynthesis glycosyltransferase [Burkholderiaceae bacterium]
MGALQIAVLARAAIPGAAKTRLIPSAGAAGAAALQAHLTELALRRACATRQQVLLWLAGAADPAVTRLAHELGIEIQPQPDGDLGDRMLAALRHAEGCGRAGIVIGTDCPAQSPSDIARAGALLSEYDVVLQPAHDGGYVLIGMALPRPEIFADMPWGTGAVLAKTRERISALGLRHAELTALPDLDRPEDLAVALERGWIERGAWA